jgi:heterodisulfide reductase subunit C
VADQEARRPHRVLAPNVILTSDDGINLKKFKSAPPIEDVAAHCIECGFCEAVCPSRNVTTTPRQRIVLRREMARQPEGSPLLAWLQDEYEYDGIETCAADGSCAIPCPVQINTGALEKTFRRAESTPGRERAALMIARRWAAAEKLARVAVGASDIIQRTIGVRALTGLTAAARLVISDDLMPSVPGPMPRAQLRKLPLTTREGAAAAYFPACINRIFGRNPGASSGTRRCRRRWSRCRRGPASRSGFPVTSRASAAPPRGAARATTAATGGWPQRPATRCGSGAGTARCRWSSTLPPAPTGCWTTSGTTSTRPGSPGSSRSPCWTPSPGARACSQR